MTGATAFQLLHRGSVNGFSSDSFHLNCDNIPNTIIIVKNSVPTGANQYTNRGIPNSYVFGAYVSLPWDKTSGYQKGKKINLNLVNY